MPNGHIFFMKVVYMYNNYILELDETEDVKNLLIRENCIKCDNLCYNSKNKFMCAADKEEIKAKNLFRYRECWEEHK
jgi:hypothetical protein